MPLLLAKLALAAGSVGLCVACAEVVLRLLTPKERQNAGRLYSLGPNRGLGTSMLLPSARALQHGEWIETNRLGLRDREYTVEKPPGTVRVAFFGDSFTYGYGVPLAQVFTERLEARLGETFGAGRVEVWNFGSPGMNSFEELLYYASYGRQFEPDLVVQVWVPFDRERNGYSYADFERFAATGAVPAARPAARGERVGGESRSRFYREYARRLYVSRFFLRRLKGVAGRFGFNLNRSEELALVATDSEGYRLMLASMTEFSSLAREDGAEFLLVLFLGLQLLRSDYYQDLLYSKLEAFGAAEGIPVFNLFPAFRGRRASDLHLSLVDAHPDAEGHAIAADALYDAIAPRVAAVLGRSGPGTR